MRMSATYCILISIVAILLTVALVPTYVLVHAQMNGVTAHQGGSAADTDIAGIEDDVAKTEAIIAELKKAPAASDMSEIIHEIEKSAPAGISFKTFGMEQVKGVIGPVRVQGTAQRREDLIAFKQAIEAHALFQTATVPIADLARERDVQFSMTVAVAPNTP